MISASVFSSTKREMSTIRLSAGDSVDIRKADGVTKVIKMSREGFLDVLSRKLGG